MPFLPTPRPSCASRHNLPYVTGEAGSSRREKHSRPVPGGRGFWWTDRLWLEARDLVPFPVAVADIPEFDMNCWFSEAKPPTCRAVAEHARRIQEADLGYPIILSADGRLMDGGHRLGKAWLAGLTHVQAVRFVEDPQPDWIDAN